MWVNSQTQPINVFTTVTVVLRNKDSASDYGRRALNLPGKQQTPVGLTRRLSRGPAHSPGELLWFLPFCLSSPHRSPHWGEPLLHLTPPMSPGSVSCSWPAALPAQAGAAASPRGSTFHAMVSVMAVKIQFSSPKGVLLSFSRPGILGDTVGPSVTTEPGDGGRGQWEGKR